MDAESGSVATGSSDSLASGVRPLFRGPRWFILTAVPSLCLRQGLLGSVGDLAPAHLP